MVFKLLRRAGQQAAAQIYNLNELQAVVAAGVLVANAGSGGITEKEIGQLKRSIFANTVLQGFGEAQKSTLIDTYCDKIAAGAFTGKRALRKEITDVANDRDVAQRVFDAACDVAAADGDMSDAEAAQLREIAGWLNIEGLAEYGL
jgi:tellurite resistance protein